MDKDRISRIVVRCLMLTGIILFWAGVISLLVCCRTSKHVEANTQTTATEDVKVEQKAKEEVLEITKELANYDVVIEQYTTPDSVGVQHIASKTFITAKKAKETTKEQTAQVDSVADVVKNEETKANNTVKTKNNTIPLYYIIVLGAICIILYFFRRFS